MVGHAQCQQTALASLVLEGVFERFPKLKMVMIEAGDLQLTADGALVAMHDTTVDRTENADVCAAQVVADGGSAVVVPAEGEHGDPSTYDLPALLAFFESTAG